MALPLARRARSDCAFPNTHRGSGRLVNDLQEGLSSVTFGPRNSPVEATPEEPTGPVAEQTRYQAEHPITVPTHFGRPYPLGEAHPR